MPKKYYCFFIAVFMTGSFYACNNNTDKEPAAGFIEKQQRDSASKARREKQLHSLTEHIGERFSIDNFIDTSGKTVNLDFTKSPITIIDFWINECPPCNVEMSHFKKILQGREKKISVISISVSSFIPWKNLFTETTGRYKFLKDAIPNWNHITLRSSDDPKLKHSISSDRYNELTQKLDISFFPSYFVLNKEGIIQSRPISAVDFITTHL